MSAEEVDDRRGSFVSAADSFGDQHEIAQRAADEGRRVREEVRWTRASTRGRRSLRKGQTRVG